MVESIKELNRICQKPRYKEVGNWMVRNILREAALPATWLLLHTSVTANQVTVASLIVGLAGIGALVFHPTACFVLGVFLIQLWYYLDHVDGQIARYRHTVSLTGRFLDFLTHHIMHGTVLFGLGFYVFRLTGNSFFMLWGFVASMAILSFNMIHDVKYKAYCEKMYGAKSIEVLASEKTGSPEPPAVGGGLDAKKIFSFLHKICEIHVLMNILTACAVLQIFFGTALDYRAILFFVYAVVAPVIAIVKMTYIVRQQKIDSDFRSEFSLHEEQS
ncbi:MAG: CDP-alcohol phosphatidyltransferase family protein [Candidatus Omnitrophica bacterium]|nr:CDP-alcohol phosphatidyltransferase family protein [Candidatus Omnitrophota bacterium]MDD5671057.1 CDP-alcohol phosphatidyltransferase family protein [Candidatus Omnitrophota bacterium]